jgi:hypothetical protein
MWWEQLVLLVNCTVGMFFSMAENDIFDDEMNTFGSISVMGCFVWLLFAIELTGEAIWLLPMLSMMCLIPADMLMIRYGALRRLLLLPPLVALLGSARSSESGVHSSNVYMRIYRGCAGHIQEETKDERTGAIVPGKNVIDGDYASHAIYFVVRTHALTRALLGKIAQRLRQLLPPPLQQRRRRQRRRQQRRRQPQPSQLSQSLLSRRALRGYARSVSSLPTCGQAKALTAWLV